MCICVYSASGVLLRSSDGGGGSGRLRANWNAAGPAQLSWADEVQFAQSFPKKKGRRKKKRKWRVRAASSRRWTTFGHVATPCAVRGPSRHE